MHDADLRTTCVDAGVPVTVAFQIEPHDGLRRRRYLVGKPLLVSVRDDVHPEVPRVACGDHGWRKRIERERQSRFDHLYLEGVLDFQALESGLHADFAGARPRHESRRNGRDEIIGRSPRCLLGHPFR